MRGGHIGHTIRPPRMRIHGTKETHLLLQLLVSMATDSLMGTKQKSEIMDSITSCLSM